MPRQAREARFTTEMQRYLRAHKQDLPRAYAWEVKVSTDDNALPFDAVKEHQIHALEIAKWHCFVYKISDIDGMVQKPCDGVTISGAGLLIFYWQRKGNKEFYIIDIDVFVNEKETSKRKSLTESRAKEIALLVGKLA